MWIFKQSDCDNKLVDVSVECWDRCSSKLNAGFWIQPIFGTVDGLGGEWRVKKTLKWARLNE